MLALTEDTLARIRVLFPPEQQQYVASILEEECGNNLPFRENATPETAERIRFAVLKLSEGKLEKFIKSVVIAKRDWRDALVWSGFGNNLEAHKQWFPTPPNTPNRSEDGEL